MDKTNKFEKLPEIGSNSESQIRNQVRKDFESLPVLYCELLENKEKIKPELVNQDYVDHSPPTENKRSVERSRPQGAESDMDEEPKSLDKSRYSRYSRPSTGHSVRRSNLSRSRSVSSETDDINKEYEELNDRLNELLEKDKKSERTSDDNKRDREQSFTRDRERDRDRGRDRDRKPDRDHRDHSDNHSRRRGPSSADNEKKYIASQVAPSLSELKYNKKGLEELTPTGTDALKRELLFKLQLLKKSYPDFNDGDDFTMHTNYEEMVERYDMASKRLRVNSDVDTYRGYLQAGFMIIEKYLAPLLSIDMTGFANEQFVHMNKYDSLLFELGEKHYVPTGSQWPVEVRLIGLMFMQTALFIISKQIMGSFKMPSSSFKKPTTKMSGPPMD